MKRTLLLLVVMCVCSAAYSQFSIVVLDSMDMGIQFIDNALRMDPPPEGYDEAIPSYKIMEVEDNQNMTFPAATLDSLPLATGVPGLFRSWPSMDFLFPRPVDRSPGDTIIVEFDLMFSAAGGSGESGRMHFTLLTDLPEGGITATNFGKPAYHLWIFNGSYGPALSYGGAYEDNPGWNSGAGGYYYNNNAGDPNTTDLYPNTDNYPLVPYSKKTQSGAAYFSATTWKHYTWVIARDMMHLYWRNTGADPEEDEEILFMAIPQNSSLDFINEVHGTFASQLPPEYEWFETVNGFRVWSRGASNHAGYFTNLNITKSGTPVTTYVEFQQLAAARRRVRADAETYALPMFLYNGVDGDPTSVMVRLAKGDPGHIDGFTEQVMTFPDDTGGELVAQSLELTLTDMYKQENDTLVFELTDIAGGYFPAYGPNRRFELVIRPSGATPPTSIIDQVAERMALYPNPASTNIQVKNLPAGGKVQIDILDVTGRLVFSDPEVTSGTLNISHLREGVYFVNLITEDLGVVTRKLIKR